MNVYILNDCMEKAPDRDLGRQSPGRLAVYRIYKRYNLF